ncbi:MAG: uroporphyrinogen-III C-methyltransferase [Rhizobiaceae bacterium]
MSLETALGRLRHIAPSLEPGDVWLAGAGPGDPGCLTLDVLSGLAQADALVHDALVSAAVLDVAGDAERFFVGKRAGQPSMKQPAINELIVRLARDGRKVLRLKGGDPYVFGRGGEEAVALATAGIRFRVLPGVTAAVGALAAVGIPATMRGINKALILATGHSADDEEDFDWEALARTGQPIVIYMALRRLGAISDALLAGGMAENTPAAVVMAATLPEERVLVSTLGRVAEEAAREGLGSPALVAFGGIVALRAILAPFQIRSLP